MRTKPSHAVAALAVIVGASVVGTAAYAGRGSAPASTPSTSPTSGVAEPLQDCVTTATLPGTDVTTTTSAGTTIPDAAGTATDASASTTTTTLPPLPVPVPPPADNDPEPQQYFGRIEIPAIDVDSPFLEGIRLSTLDYGPGHWPCTAMPGDLGNVVVAGHRTSHNADFRRLDELQPGDEVIFDMDDSEGIPTATVADPDAVSGVYVYHVASVEIVPPDAMWIVSQGYRHEATLFACHPPGSVSERIVAHLDLYSVDGEPAPVPTDPPRTTTTTAAPTTDAA
jgi:sortase A